MVNKPLIRPYFLAGVALGGGVARIPMIIGIPDPKNESLLVVTIASWERTLTPRIG